eukprot:IDg10054t1
MASLTLPNAPSPSVSSSTYFPTRMTESAGTCDGGGGGVARGGSGARAEPLMEARRGGAHLGRGRGRGAGRVVRRATNTSQAAHCAAAIAHSIADTGGGRAARSAMLSTSAGRMRARLARAPWSDARIGALSKRRPISIVCARARTRIAWSQCKRLSIMRCSQCSRARAARATACARPYTIRYATCERAPLTPCARSRRALAAVMRIAVRIAVRIAMRVEVSHALIPTNHLHARTRPHDALIPHRGRGSHDTRVHVSTANA